MDSGLRSLGQLIRGRSDISSLRSGGGNTVVYSVLHAGGKTRCGSQAALVGTLSAVLLAIFVWGIPAETAVNATIMGACFGIFPIVWIVITAVWVYNMTVESGEFEIIKNSLASLTDDRRLQAIFIAFGSSTKEGTARFGTPVVITAVMLVDLGFNPLYGAGICLIANTTSVAFGATGIPVVVAAGVSGLTIMHISKIVGCQLPFLSIIVPFWLCVAMCGFKRTFEVLPAILVSGFCFAGAQYLSSNFHEPYLPDIISAIVTIAGMVILLKIWRLKNTFRFADEETPAGPVKCDYTVGEILRAWSSYIILAVMVFIWGRQGFKTAMAGFNVAIPWPALHNLVVKTTPIVAQNADYAAVYGFNFVTAARTAILLSGPIASFIMPGYGIGKALSCLVRTTYQLRFPIATIAMILGLTCIMNYSGMSSTLGLAFTNAGPMFPFFSPILGWFWVFLTGSNTSSSALFGSLQSTTAQAVGGDPHLTVAGNASGGVTGKMISPQSISAATAATGMIGQEGNFFRFALWHSIAMTLAICAITMFQAYWFSWMLP